MTRQYPIRTQRKAENRERLIVAAQELFKLKGYEATTLEGVAERAGVHSQTLYRHFKSKVELAAAGDEVQLAHFQSAIENNDRNETTIQFWRNYLTSAVEMAAGADEGRSYREVLHQYLESPAISSQLIRVGSQYRALLSQSLERDLNIEDPTERAQTAHLIAITLWGAHDYVQKQHERGEEIDLALETLAAVDRVEKLFTHLMVSTD
jgi:AcrR family transcriptional regulator